MVSRALSRASTSAGESTTSAAPAFSHIRSTFRLPGMGTMYGFLHSIQAREIWAGVARFRSARSRSSSSSARFCSAASGVNWGMALR